MKLYGLTEAELSAALDACNARHGSTIHTVFGGWGTQGHTPWVRRVGRALQFALRVDKCSDPFHRRGPEHAWRGHKPKRMVSLCWHGFKAFMQEVYLRHPNARFVTGAARYRDRQHFEDVHRETFHRNAGSQALPQAYGDLCDCDQGEDWPEAPYDFDAGGIVRPTHSYARPEPYTEPEDHEVSGADDSIVPDAIVASDPNRWAEYNRKFNDLLMGRAKA